MSLDKQYIDINRASWNNKTQAHLDSEFYDMPSFLKGRNTLNEIELNLLGKIKGKSILHLQCHFGQDSISMSRLGAEVTAVDLSDIAIDNAQQIAKETDSNVNFICSDIYELRDHLDKEFDIVFTSYGTIGWLPDLEKWAQLISYFLKPKGEFVFVEFHPVVWMFDDDFEKIAYRYFNSGPIVETESGTYADKDAKISQSYMMWNHGISEVLNNLIGQGMQIQSFDEYDYSPYNCFEHTVEIEKRKFRIKHLENKIPMVYALKAVKK